MKFNRIIKFVFAFLLVFSINIGCEKKESSTKSYYVAILSAWNTFDFPEEVREDLELVSSLQVNGYEVKFEWTTSSQYLDNEGHIHPDESDHIVVINCKATIDDYTMESDVAIVTVKAIEKVIDYDAIIDKAEEQINIPLIIINDIALPTSLEIDEYQLDLNWTSSDNALSTTGVCVRKEVDTIVTLEVTISLESHSKSFEYEVTIKALDEEDECDYISELLLVDLDKNYLELLDCPVTKLATNCEFFFSNQGNLNNASKEDLMIGLTNLEIYVENEEIVKVCIPQDFTFTDIRVAIRNSINDIADIETLYHDTISLTLQAKTIIKAFDNSVSYEIEPGTIIFSLDNEEIKVQVNSLVTYSFNKKVIIEGTNSEIKVNNISRSGNLMYAGSMDISIVDGRLLLVNEVNVEEYLRKVVPSEMPSSWNSEALKAQAVAARTYAYCEYYNKKYLEYGYVVDDSTSSQVYNNQKTTTSTDKAVKETEGLVMFYDNLPIVAYYFSSSCGLTANGNEVWMYEGVVDEIPYLIGKNLSTTSAGDVISVDPTSEASMLAYFKLNDFINPGGSASYHRWKITYTKEQLQNTINANLQMMAATYPTSYVQLINNEWVVADFPSDIGTIQDVFVSERGSSGVVVSLQVVTDKITFKIYNQYNIRFTIRGRDAGSKVTLYYGSSGSNYRSTSNNPSILNSGFFALEWNDDELTFYGGGNGHGVGMDQYGANYYAKNGKTFEEILKTYYSNIEFKQTIQ